MTDANDGNPMPQEVSLEEYNKIQIEWIKVHKWFLSEKAGHDVGFNNAAVSWVDCGLAKTFRNYFKIKTKK
jgi:hypothetical protein